MTLVVFDNDGVLVDSERLANALLAQLLTEEGVPTTVEHSIRTYMGGSFDRVRRLAEEQAGFRLPDDLEERFQARLATELRSRLRPVAGARELLEALSASGVPYCVASGSSRERLRMSLAVTGLSPLLGTSVFSRDDVTEGKPAPDLFLHAAARMGFRPDEAVVVEDSPLGVQAARAAGMRVIGFAATTPPERLAAADRVVTTFQSLHGLLLPASRAQVLNTT